jgi:hypothetical protein
MPEHPNWHWQPLDRPTSHLGRVLAQLFTALVPTLRVSR